MESSQRRLSAILYADLAGSVRMTEGDEDLTFMHLTSARSEIWRPAIEAAGGSLVNSTGDSLLAEFGSAVAAVAAAIDIQERMARFNEMLDDEQRLMFRIGVHLGRCVDQENRHIRRRREPRRTNPDSGRTRRNRRFAHVARRYRAQGRLRLCRWWRAPCQECKSVPSHLSCPSSGRPPDEDSIVRPASGDAALSGHRPGGSQIRLQSEIRKTDGKTRRPCDRPRLRV